MNGWNAPLAPLAPAAMALPDDPTLKDQFAEALLKDPLDPFRAACTVFGTDTMKALQASQLWTFDLYVLQRQAELLDANGEDTYLPTRALVARKVYQVGEAATDPKDKLAAYKLYSDIRGFIAKDIVNNTVNNTVNHNKVMVVKDMGTAEEWETKAVKHQAKLIEHSRT